MAASSQVNNVLEQAKIIFQKFMARSPREKAGIVFGLVAVLFLLHSCTGSSAAGVCKSSINTYRDLMGLDRTSGITFETRFVGARNEGKGIIHCYINLIGYTGNMKDITTHEFKVEKTQGDNIVRVIN